METRKQTFVILPLIILIALSGLANASHRWNLLEPYEPEPSSFKELEIGKKIVYWHQRKIGQAVVGGDELIYHFDKNSGKLLNTIARWREDLPDELPVLKITKKQAESMVKGSVRFSYLYYISPKSVVFSPIRPTPKNPCWIIATLEESNNSITVIDAVEGKILGQGVPPPYTAFSLTGPCYYLWPCRGSWVEWYTNARDWFNRMGYSTEAVLWPTQNKVRSHIQSHETAMFYELAHGDYGGFINKCYYTHYETITASEIETWMTGYSKMPFTFIGSCGGMCDVGDNTFSYEFRKGSMEDTATVGYCHMDESYCSLCWDSSIDWQNTLFKYMHNGYTVKEAFDLTNGEYPECSDNECMRFAGDEDFAVVATRGREKEVENITKGKIYSSIQDSINDANEGDEIIVHPGTFHEQINFLGKTITLRSACPNNYDVTEATVIDGNSATNVVAFGTGSEATLRGFTITGGSVGINFTQGSGSASNCIIRNNTDRGVTVYQGNATVRNSFIWDNGDEGIYAELGAFTVKNSVIFGHNTGIEYTYATGTVRNTTIVNNTNYGILHGPYGGATISNCILWNNNDDLYSCHATYSCISDCNDVNETNHNICSDPCFVDADGNDFHLDIHSPCVHRGNPSVNYGDEVDIDCEPRVIGSYVDMGADEVNVPVSDAHQWGLDEKSGTTAKDSVGDANGSFNGDDPRWVYGLFGGAIDCNGVNDYFSVSSLDNTYSSTSTFTVAGWFKTSQSTGMQTIVGQWLNFKTGQSEYYPTLYFGWQVLVENNKVVARFGPASSSPSDITSDVNDGEWHHFALVYPTSSSNAVLYVDGQSQGTPGTKTFYPHTYDKFRIGDGSFVYAPSGGTPALKGGPFNGMIDDVMIFYRVLSAEEVEQLYQDGLEY